MQVVKSVRISLTMGDIVDNLPQLSKQQIIEKFRILLDRKQIEINEKIEKNNAEHLLLLQKKMLILQRKDDQIVKLNNMLSQVRNQLNDQKIRNNDLTDQALECKMRAVHFEKKFNQHDSIFKEQKSKREKLKKEHEKLLSDYKILSEENSKEMRNHRKVKEEKTNWQEQTQLLLNNLKKTHQKQFQQKTKNVKLEFDQRLSSILENLHEEQKKREAYKQKYLEAKAAQSNLNKAIELLNKELLNQKKKQKKVIKKMIETQCQTEIELLEQAYMHGKLFRNEFYEEIKSLIKVEIHEVEKSKAVEKVSQQTQASINIDCLQCRQLKSHLEALEAQLKKSKPKQIKPVVIQKPKQTFARSTQTDPEPTKTVVDHDSQTVFNPLSSEEEKELLDAFETIKRTSDGLIRNAKKKYEQMQELFMSRPSKFEDKQRINQLERKIVGQQIQMMKKQKQNEKVGLVVSQLQHKINQQDALLSQFNINAVEISPSGKKTTDEKARTIQVTSSFSLANRRNFAKSEIKDRTSYTISFREIGSKIGKINRNLSGSTTFLNTKIAEERESMEDLKLENEQSKSLHISRGINFKKKTKQDWRQHISDMRQYKKYKCSWKKVRL